MPATKISYTYDSQFTMAFVQNPLRLSPSNPTNPILPPTGSHTNTNTDFFAPASSLHSFAAHISLATGCDTLTAGVLGSVPSAYYVASNLSEPS
jgi:hypothetical protein